MGGTKRTRRDGSERRRGWVVLRGAWFAGVYLCWGLVVTVLVAWGLAWAVAFEDLPIPRRAVDAVRVPPREFVVLHATGVKAVRCWQEVEAEDRDREFGSNICTVTVPRYAEHLHPTKRKSPTVESFGMFVSGWPWLAMSYELASAPWSPPWLSQPQGSNVELVGALQISAGQRPGRSYPPDGGVRLPLLPLWRGLIANTLFYALLVWLLRRGFVVLRGWRRSRRGRCGWGGGCGYDLAGSVGEVCPECGRPVMKETRLSPEALRVSM